MFSMRFGLYRHTPNKKAAVENPRQLSTYIKVYWGQIAILMPVREIFFSMASTY